MWYKGLASIIISYLLWVYLQTTDNSYCMTSIIDNSTNCRPNCSYGEFSLYGMKSCVPWLGCEEIKTEVKGGEIIGQGAVKTIRLGYWRHHQVVINELKNQDYSEDYQDGLNNLILFQPDFKVVHLIGYCRRSNQYITEYHPLQSPDQLESLMIRYPHLNTVKTRLNFCLEYITIIEFLHTRSHTKMVMCDSNTPGKTLSQVLIREDLTLVLNDADALPVVDGNTNRLVKCGQRELTGDYVAPEQLWPYESEFDDNIMPGYDEKTDIWKIPDVCKLLLGQVPGTISVLLKLFEINSKCKQEFPWERPTVTQVLNAYKSVYKQIV